MTSNSEKLTMARWMVLFSVFVLIASWVWANLPRLAVGQNGVLTFFLGSMFALILILRKKLEGEGFKLPGWALAGIGGTGFLFALVGIIVPIHQLEWLGVLFVMYAALAWALPRRYGRDLVFALALVYWIHPLPSQLFGPLQLGMQWMSVKLSEALLQFFNVRIWGDGFVLRTSARVFGVPEACSGMKTAVTVLFCGVGVGLLMRLRGWSLAGLLLVGVVQVLALNVIRISGIVWAGMDKPADWDITVLHDTMGIFLLLSVALIHVDAALINQWLNRRRRRQELRLANDEVGEDEDKRRRWPDFWRIIMAGWPVIVALLVIAAAVGGIIWRLSPHHRAEMIRGAAEGMMSTGDKENAQRAVQAGLALEPGNEALLADLARILISRGKQEEGLRILLRKPPAARSITERILEVQALLELKRMDEAVAVVASLPKASYDMPGVALVLAQFNAILDRPDEVARHVVKAARGIGTQEGIRRLFPYMAARDLWESIRQADSGLRYALPVHGMIAAEARLRANDLKGAAEVLRRALKDYEREPIFLRQVVRMAREWPKSEWSDRFESLFLANIGILKPADLILAMEGSFTIGRPQLAWMAYRRLMTVAPDDPMLLIAPAQYARQWFQFNHARLGIASAGSDLVDAKPFYQWASTLPPWKGLWDRIPLAGELGGVVTKEGFDRTLKASLAALEKMEAKGPLEFRLQMLWVQLLGQLGRWDEAHEKLRQFEAAEPALHRNYLLVHANLYKSQSDWEACFEALSEYARLEPHPPLTAWIDLAHAAMALNLGSYAMGCMDEARRDYPESDEWSLAMAAILSAFGDSEKALHLIGGMRHQPHSAIRARLLMDTGRVVEGQKLITLDNLPDYTGQKRQGNQLPPAEWTLEWKGGQLQKDDYERERSAIRDRNVPFLKALNGLKLSWYEQQGKGMSSDIKFWEGVGNDNREKASALNLLGVALLRQGRSREAAVVCERALELQPAWSLLWRMRLISANEGGAATNSLASLAQQAVKACPQDDEIWLANLVAQVRNGADEKWCGTEVAQAIEGKRRSPGTLVRGGDFLTRMNYVNAASAAIRAAIKDGKGLLPGYVAGLSCAIKMNDVAWALECARAGADQSLEPSPFYKTIVQLKSRKGRADPDMIRALEGLSTQYPEQGTWSEKLGEAYFLKGQTDRALGVLEDALAREKGDKQASPRTFLLAAESARREGNISRAIKILKICHARYPNDLQVLNNLIYVLAQDPASVSEAAGLLPELLRGDRNNFAVYDTAALVYSKSGDLVRAEEYMKKALALVKKGEYAWMEVYLNAAETQFRLGKYKAARESLDLIMKSKDRSAAIDLRARELQNELSKKERDSSWF